MATSAPEVEMERRGTVYVNWRPAGDEWPPSGEVQWFTSWQDDVGPVEGEDVPSVAQAVEWGVARSDRVVVIYTDGMTYWAGADPVPEDVVGRWPPGS